MPWTKPLIERNFLSDYSRIKTFKKKKKKKKVDFHMRISNAVVRNYRIQEWAIRAWKKASEALSVRLDKIQQPVYIISSNSFSLLILDG